ncbi:MAG: hypothetical protein ABI478_06555, partial [Propionivibrio sp.]
MAYLSESIFAQAPGDAAADATRRRRRLPAVPVTRAPSPKRRRDAAVAGKAKAPSADRSRAAPAFSELRYVHESEVPGITRRRAGKGFSYRRPDG